MKKIKTKVEDFKVGYTQMKDDLVKKLNLVPTIIKQKRKINTLELKVEMLENTIKDELYKEFMEKLGEPIEIERLKNDNKRLRKKVKQLKELIKEEE